MRKLRVLSIALVSAVWLSSAPAAARGGRNRSAEGEFSFQVESDGRVLPVFDHRGRSYVEGEYGELYAVRIYNNTDFRAEAVATVDGRNVITGEPGDYRSQRGYVIEPHGSVLIDGFRRSMEQVAAFRFSELGESYAARMGDPDNVGVIGVALFREKAPEPRPLPPIAYDRPRAKRLGTGYGEAPVGAQAAPSGKSAPSASAYGGDRAAAEAGRSYESQGMGTAWGEDTYSPATSTRFTRRSANRPDAMLELRYDDHQGLVSKGVLPRPAPAYRHPRPAPDPFPAAMRFAPPPPDYCWE